MPDYFSKSEESCPADFSKWNLCESYNLSIMHITEKPKFMQPKSNKSNVTIDNYFVSPRMIVKKV